ncbi:hypothetical protein EDB86DRAFT_1085260 [Lactarius hatsudake]|nr:hypothetical protein EDB86DRAFT_1085260 [Lactarius hatsudake]
MRGRQDPPCRPLQVARFLLPLRSVLTGRASDSASRSIAQADSDACLPVFRSARPERTRSSCPSAAVAMLCLHLLPPRPPRPSHAHPSVARAAYDSSRGGGACMIRLIGVGVDALWGFELELISPPPYPPAARSDAHHHKRRHEKRWNIGFRIHRRRNDMDKSIVSVLLRAKQRRGWFVVFHSTTVVSIYGSM